MNDLKGRTEDLYELEGIEGLIVTPMSSYHPRLLIFQVLFQNFRLSCLTQFYNLYQTFLHEAFLANKFSQGKVSNSVPED